MPWPPLKVSDLLSVLLNSVRSPVLLLTPAERAVGCLAWAPPNPQEDLRIPMSSDTVLTAPGPHHFTTTTTSRAHTHLPLKTLLKSAT